MTVHVEGRDDTLRFMAALKPLKSVVAVIHLNGNEMPDIDVPSDISPRPFFDEQVMTFLADLSRQLLASPEGHLYPDLTAFAFYIRKANLAKLQQIFAGCERRMGRDYAFISPPPISP